MIKNVLLLNLSFLCFTLSLPVNARETLTNKTFNFNIPSTSATSALEALSKQTGKNLFYPANKLNGITSRHLVGQYTLVEALTILLAETKVQATITSKGVIVVRDRKKKREQLNSTELSTLFGVEPINKQQSTVISDQLQNVIESISVTGYRESLNQSLSFKKNADHQVDVISAEDIGKLPDVEVGDVLERIAGVQVSRGDDGIVNGTSIRGLPGYFNRTLYNDRVLNTSLSTERYFDAQIIPAAFFNRVEVHKTSVADTVEGGLAGVINLKSLRAFDIGERAARVKLTGTSTSNDDNKNSELVAIYSDLYLDESLGFTAGVNVLNSNRESQQGFTFNPTIKLTEGVNKDYNGDGTVSEKDIFYVPQAIGYSLNQNTRQRDAFFANLEWRPSANFSAFGEIFFTGYDTLDNRNYLRFRPKPANKSAGEGAQTVSYQGELYENGPRDYLTVYQPTNIYGELSNQYNERESDTGLAFFDLEWLYQRWSVNFSANLSKSKTHQLSMLAKNLTERNYFDITLDGTDEGSAWAVTFHNPVDDPQYSQRGLLNDPQAPFHSLTVDGTHVGAEFESNSWASDLRIQYDLAYANNYLDINELEFGFHYRVDESLTQKPEADFGGNTEHLFNGAELSYREIMPASGQWFDFKKNETGAPLLWVVPDISAMAVAQHWTSDSVRAAAIASESYTPGIFENLQEQIFASYFKLNFASDSERISGNLGVRYTHTIEMINGQGAQIEEGLIDEGEGDPFDPNYDPSLVLPINDNMSKKRSYHNILPSLNIMMKAKEDLILRFGWSKTMSRPLRHDLELQDSYNARTNTISSADPLLAPFIADNLDLSLGWYFAKESALHLAWFYKDIDNLVRTVQYQTLLPVTHAETGIALDDTLVNIAEKQNGDTAIVQGTTLSYQQPFSFLSGFLKQTGVTANFTYIDDSRAQSLTDISNNNGSILFYYDSALFDAQISYTYRGPRMRKLATTTVPTKYINSSNIINASINYMPVEYLTLSLGVHNIGEESISEYYGNGMSDHFSDFGRVYSFTITGIL
ncbi:TonB-dependent receptor [Thalassotalea sp. PLHSN55]|uniref:TonB-dependent receptor n=1 Tax=Thalassotalea sp. PLHSN55 TaxID=3435888 RepID=UPI003F82739D